VKYEEYKALEFVLAARKPVSPKDVLAYLNESVEGFSGRQGADGGLKNTQNWLKNFTDDENFSRMIEVTINGVGKRYKGVGASKEINTEMGVEQACSLLMSDKHLSALAPTRLFQSQDEYRELINRAEAVVAKHQKFRIQNRKNVGDFMKRITVMQRGQRLIGADVDDEVLECIASCILQQRCINLTYHDKKRVLHPFGVVFRQPKIYLLAVDTETLINQGRSKVRPRQWLCNRIEKASMSREAHQVPEEFDVDEYVNQGRLDVRAYLDPADEPRSFSLKLRIDGVGTERLVRDLREYPLSDHQQLDHDLKTGSYILTVPGMRATHSLMEWLLGRMSQVEVLLPHRLREHMIEKVDAMHRLYCR